MKQLLVLFCLACTSSSLFAQLGQSFYGGTGYDVFQQIIPAGNGDYYLLGSKQAGKNLVWLMKIDDDGTVLWERTYPLSGTNVDEYGHRLVILDNGNLLIVGRQRENVFRGQALVLMVDSEGQLIWKKAYPETSAAYDAVPNGDGFLICGWADRPGATNNGLLFQISSNGSLQWEKLVNVSSQNRVRRLFPTDDGNFLVLGRSNDISFGFEGVFVQKMTPEGDWIWGTGKHTAYREQSPTSLSSDYDQPLGAVRLPNGEVVVANGWGNTNTGIAVMRFSPDGELISHGVYGAGDRAEHPHAIDLLPNGNLLITGRTRSSNGVNTEEGGFAQLLRPSGLEMWRKYYGSPNASEQLFSAAWLPGGQFLLAGSSEAQTTIGNADGWLIRTGIDGNTRPWVVRGSVSIDVNGNCTADSDEPPLPQWMVVASNGTETRYLPTDEEGRFRFYTDDGSTTLALHLPGTEGAWTVCQNEVTVNSNAQHPEAEVNFAVQPSGAECPLTEVALTQPELVRCEESEFIVSVWNRGLEASEDQTLTLQLDRDLTFVSATWPSFPNGQIVEFDVPPIDGLSGVSFDVSVRLGCTAQLGANHPIRAELHPAVCEPAWAGAEFAVTGYCDGNEAVFELQNLGNGGHANTFYRLIANHIVVADEVPITLSEGAEPTLVRLPADGRTWRLELAQVPGFPKSSTSSAFVDKCGQRLNGLHDLAFQHAFSLDDAMPERAYVSPANTIGVPNRMTASVHGLGLYNLLNDVGAPLVFTANAQNPKSTAAEYVIFDFDLSPSLDLSTFEVLSAKSPAGVFSTDDGGIRVILREADVPPQGTAIVQFRIAPIAGIPPDSGEASLILVHGRAYFDEQGPVGLVSAFGNYSESFPAGQDPYYDYPPEISLFGGRNYTFGSFLEQGYGDQVFLGGESSSFSDRAQFNAYVAKTNQLGQASWQSAIRLDGGNSYTRGILPLQDGGCIVVGNSLMPGGNNRYRNEFHPFLARLDASGNTVWWRRERPVCPDCGAWVYGLVRTLDGGAILYGQSGLAELAGSSHFYWKINQSGETVWQFHEESASTGFVPSQAIALPDNNLVFLGSVDDGDHTIRLEKVNTHGARLWSRSYQAEVLTWLEGLAPAEDGGFMAAGYAQWEIEPGAYKSTPSFIKFDANGYAEWENRPIVGPHQSARIKDIKPDPSGGFLAAGEVLADFSERYHDVLLLKIEESTDTVWWRNYGSANSESAEKILVLDEEQIWLWGYNQPRAPLYNIYGLLVRTDSEGEVLTALERVAPKAESRSLVFPNPAQGQANVLLSPPPAYAQPWVLADVTGKPQAQGFTDSGIFELEMSKLSPGLYFLLFPGSSYPVQRVISVR